MSKDLEIYESYTVGDFLEDQRFREWVLANSPERDHWWKELFLLYPKQEEVAEQARLLLGEMSLYFQGDDLATKTLSDPFVAKLKQEVENSKAAKRFKASPKGPMFQIVMVASVLFVLGMVSWFALQSPEQNMQRLSTEYGEWKTLTLTDGSEVKLNANSEIQFASKWSQGEDRRVYLKGEAFFEVKKDPYRAKFTVVTEDLEVDVLGTSFNVHSRGEETGVFLIEGKVRLDLGEEQKSILPGEFIAYSAPKKEITKYNKTAPISHISWKEGSLVMQDKSVKMILDKVKEIYGFKIQVKRPELLEERKYIAIPMDKIEIAIPILERTLDTEIHLEKNLLIVD